MITISLDFQIEKTKDDYEIIRVKKNNKWIYIGSKYNMKSELEKFMEKVEEDDESKIFLVYGFGTGEHIKALRNKFEKNKIFVFEPNINMQTYIEKNQWIEKDKNIEVFNFEENIPKDKLNDYIDEFNLDYIRFVSFSNYESIYTDEMKIFLKQLKGYFISLRINRNTKMGFSKRWFQTLIKNLPYIVEGTPANLYENKYEGKPAIIVSAGPSLEKNIDELKKINDEMLIISGGRTLRTLIDKQIKPHTLAVSDPGKMSYDLVEGYIENLNIPLLFYEGTNEKVVSNHKGDKIFFSNNSFIDNIAEKKLVSLAIGGSVAHAITRWAILLGCNPIIFIGQDLAYTNDARYSLISTDRDNVVKKFIEDEDEDEIWVEGIDGNKVRTNIEFDQFRLVFEEIVRFLPNTMFINATEGGARIKGTTEMTLSEVIEKYKVKSEKIKPIKKIEYSVDMRKNAVEELEKAKKSAEFIIEKSNKSLIYLNELKVAYIMKNLSSVNSILSKLDKIDQEIKENYNDIELISSLLYPVIYETLTDKTVNNTKTGVNDMNIIIGQNKKLYEEILKQLKYSMKYIDETLLRLREK